MIRAAELVAAARTWLGVPFLHQGRSRLGVDCIGYVACVLEGLALLPAHAEDGLPNYARNPGPGLVAAMRKHFEPLPAAIPGALVLIHWPAAVYPSHVAICTGATLLHCYQQAGRVVEHGYRAPWLAMTDSTWRVRGVA